MGSQSSFFSYKHLKLKQSVFNRLYGFYGNLSRHDNVTITCSTMAGHLFDTIIVALADIEL